MSDALKLILILGLVGLGYELLKQAPTIIWTFHDARVSRRLTPDFSYTRRDLVTAISTAIDRSAEPTFGPTMRDRVALTVIEDLDAGRLAPTELEIPEARRRSSRR